MAQGAGRLRHFSDLAERLGARDAFTEGRTVCQWLEHCMSRHGRRWRTAICRREFRRIRASDGLILPQAPDDADSSAFRDDPDGARLPTPSGKIESSRRRSQALGRRTVPVIPDLACAGPGAGAINTAYSRSNQPTTRLHSQLDFGGTARRQSIAAARSHA